MWTCWITLHLPLSVQTFVPLDFLVYNSLSDSHFLFKGHLSAIFCYVFSVSFSHFSNWWLWHVWNSLSASIVMFPSQLILWGRIMVILMSHYIDLIRGSFSFPICGVSTSIFSMESSFWIFWSRWQSFWSQIWSSKTKDLASKKLIMYYLLRCC